MNEWKAAKQEVKDILSRVAATRNPGVITYSALAKRITALHFSPYEARFFDLLGEVSIEEDEAGRGMLTAIVITREFPNMPGRGFFELAELRGHITKDPLLFWVAEVNRVQRYWQAHRPK